MALTKFNFNSFDVTSAASKGLGFNASANGFSTIDPGSMTLIKTLTASSSSTLSFVDGSSNVVLDNTYSVYMFKFINIHSSNDGVAFQFNLSVDTGSNYNVAKTSTFIEAFNFENAAAAEIGYGSSHDLAQGTGSQRLTSNQGNAADESGSGTLFLFNPSSTTFVKHFLSNLSTSYFNNYLSNDLASGYANTTSAVDAIKFEFSAGTIESGTIKLYGIKDS
jgi:hypothetical protein